MFSIPTYLTTYICIIGEGKVHGCMVGRQAIKHPYYWRHIDSTIYSKNDPGIDNMHIHT